MTTPEQVRRRLRVLDAQTVRMVQSRETALLKTLADFYALAAKDLDFIAMQAFQQFGAPATWSMTDMRAAQRTAWLMDQIVSRSDVLYSQTVPAMQTAMYDSYRDGYYIRGWTLSQVLPVRPGLLTLPVVPEQAIAAALSFPYEGSNFFERMGDVRLDFIRKVRKTITLSQIEGEGMRQVQKRLANELGWPIGRRKKAERIANKGNYARTQLIARTEMMRASNLGTQTVDKANSDIVKAWEWITARDERTCDICAPLDGRVWPLGKGSRPPIHPRCRCSSLPVRKTDEELGLPPSESALGPRETYRDWAKRMGHPIPA